MAKEKKKPKKALQRWKLYRVSNNKLERKNKYCPKCGVGAFLSQHKDRLFCGTCHYTEFLKK